MRKILIGIAALVVAASAVVGVEVGGGAAGASTAAPKTTTAITGAFASGMIDSNFKGISHWTERGKVVKVAYHGYGLNPLRTYFTVLYGNLTCDPAQAFPVLIGQPNAAGVLVTHVTVQDTIGSVVAGSSSVSTRIGDTDAMGNPTDQDSDGKFGPTDVVAVPGQPSIGLDQCDGMPVHA